MKRPGQTLRRRSGTACGIPPEESRPAEGKAGGKEKRPAEKKSQLAGAAPRREEQKKHCDYGGIPLHSSYFFFCIICFNLSDIVLNYYFRQTFVAAYGRK